VVKMTVVSPTAGVGSQEDFVLQGSPMEASGRGSPGCFVFVARKTKEAVT